MKPHVTQRDPTPTEQGEHPNRVSSYVTLLLGKEMQPFFRGEPKSDCNAVLSRKAARVQVANGATNFVSAARLLVCPYVCISMYGCLQPTWPSGLCVCVCVHACVYACMSAYLSFCLSVSPSGPICVGMHVLCRQTCLVSIISCTGKCRCLYFVPLAACSLASVSFGLRRSLMYVLYSA